MSRPRLATDLRASHGVAAIALFGVLAAVFVTADFPEPTGFESGLSVMDGIGYALFDMAGQSGLVTEGFLVSFVLIAVVLDAALDGAILLARDEDGSVLSTNDGGAE
ncbi:NADH dehydrogenase I subunit J protein [Halorhabdus tiamatea SARL4B]|uniref:NADH dehydrogenase I subunit J protein n=1 Tax=Halorhabdus tiamatea SARL4B TaxID=1033806 RepID=F7PP75_9EURY|nr:hypothetical protein [Halorhabdus tiamatea]ERJ07130.1 NADH dehydrogenase I subunit J protein [Halorhabdus tiamatea SARL4B]CCQ32751.1 NADH dehydrogenase-like complex, subunit J2 [Halorhabdus tiamatea SARL4B]